jgi:hypothetical protein
MDFSGMKLKISYSNTALKPGVSFRHPFKEIRLNRKKKVVVERQTEQKGLWLEGEQIQTFGKGFVRPGMNLTRETGKGLPRDLLDSINPFESFTPGLAVYY